MTTETAHADDLLGNTMMTVLESAERSSTLSLSLFELLTEKGETALANIAWVFHLEASQSAEMLGASLGIEVNV